MFKRLTIEAKALLDQTLGFANDFSLNLANAVNAGSGGFFGGPSIALVEEAAEIVRGAINHLRRKPQAINTSFSPAALKQPYVDPLRLAEIRALKHPEGDFAKLAQLCGEINIAYEHECHFSTAFLLRTIIDHIPPVLGFKTFSELASNYRGPKSFKKSMQTLNASLRNIADAHLHLPIRSREKLPTITQVDFRQDLDVLLQEVVRQVAE
jgi:hypothetical protein